jgi:hypothetical protein
VMYGQNGLIEDDFDYEAARRIATQELVRTMQALEASAICSQSAMQHLERSCLQMARTVMTGSTKAVEVARPVGPPHGRAIRIRKEDGDA